MKKLFLALWIVLISAILCYAPDDVGIIVDMAEDVGTDTTNFDGHLSATEDDIQKALDVLDDITTGDDDLSDNTTDDLAEGSNNLYYTEDRAKLISSAYGG